MSFKSFILREIQRQLPPLGNKRVAIGARAYMKDIAPFLGVKTPPRRKLSHEIFSLAGTPTSDELGTTARALWKLDEREYQYVGYDLIGYFIESANKSFLADHVEYLLTHKSWWDPVDSLGNNAVSPLTIRYNLLPLMNKWNRSSNMWLNRAVIGHQRGRKMDTDIPLLLKYCDDHSGNHEFFIAKAIGWALRDLAKFDRTSVNKFLASHPDLDRIAVREARRHE